MVPVAFMSVSPYFKTVTALGLSFARESRRFGASRFSAPYNRDSFAR